MPFRSMSPYYCPSRRPQKTKHTFTPTHCCHLLHPLWATQHFRSERVKEAGWGKKFPLSKRPVLEFLPLDGKQQRREKTGQYSRVQRTEEKTIYSIGEKVQSVFTHTSMHNTHPHAHTDRLLLTRDRHTERNSGRDKPRGH